MPASIFAGSKVKALKSTLSLNGGADIISSATDPTSSAVDASPGSLLVNTTTGKQYRKNDSGSTTNWTEIGSGSTGKNYITQSTFDNNSTTGWSKATVTVDSTTKAVSGNITAGAASITTFAPDSVTPIAGKYDLSVGGTIAQGAAFISDAFAIDREDMAKVLGFSFAYEATSGTMNFSGTSSNTFAVWIAEVTTATPDTVVSWIQPAGVYNLVQSSGVGIASGTFQTTATGTAYRLAVVCITAPGAAVECHFDDFQVGPQKTLQGPSGPVGEIIAYGSLTPPVGFLYCDGTAVSRTTYSDLFKAIGTTYGVGDGSTTFNLPNLKGVFARGAGSQTIGGITYSGTLGSSQNDQMQGHKHTATTSPSNGSAIAAFTTSIQAYGSATSSGFPMNSNAGSAIVYNTTVTSPTTDGVNGTPRTGSETNPANVAVAYHIRYLATYQMSQDTDTRVVAAIVTGNPQASYTAATPIIFPTVSKDTHSSYNNSTGQYTSPISGFYRITAFANTNVAAGNLLYCYVGGVQQSPFMGTSQTGGYFSGTTTVYANAGQTIDVRASIGWSAVSGGGGVAFERLSGPATIAASEFVGCAFEGCLTTLSNAGATLIFPVSGKTYDSHGAYNTTTGIFTVPVSGKYLISCFLLTSQTTGTASITLNAFQTGSATRTIELQRQEPKTGLTAANGRKTLQGSVYANCLAGDTLYIVGYDADATSSIANTRFAITRIG